MPGSPVGDGHWPTAALARRKSMKLNPLVATDLARTPSKQKRRGRSRGAQLHEHAGQGKELRG